MVVSQYLQWSLLGRCFHGFALAAHHTQSAMNEQWTLPLGVRKPPEKSAGTNTTSGLLGDRDADGLVAGVAAVADPVGVDCAAERGATECGAPPVQPAHSPASAATTTSTRRR